MGTGTGTGTGADRGPSLNTASNGQSSRRWTKNLYNVCKIGPFGDVIELRLCCTHIDCKKRHSHKPVEPLIMTLPATEPLTPTDTNTTTHSVTSPQKRVVVSHVCIPPRGKENNESLLNGDIKTKSQTTTAAAAAVEETIDIESVDGPTPSDTEYTEDGRPIRKRKAKVPFDEDTEMDTDELLEKEVKTKKKPSPKAKVGRTPKAAKDEASTVKAPRKTTRKIKSAFSDDDESS
ncbi:hypothetical protein BX616_010113, partial [Lobosporangium transversale]